MSVLDSLCWSWGVRPQPISLICLWQVCDLSHWFNGAPNHSMMEGFSEAVMSTWLNANSILRNLHAWRISYTVSPLAGQSSITKFAQVSDINNPKWGSDWCSVHFPPVWPVVLSKILPYMFSNQHLCSKSFIYTLRLNRRVFCPSSAEISSIFFFF